MMKYLTIVLFFLLCSCNEKSPPQPIDFSQDEIIIEDVIDPSESSYSKRVRLPLVHVLYEEAKKRDTRLAALDQSIVDMEQIHMDSTKAYRAFMQYNTNYYRSANDYLSGIQDTAARASLRSMLKISSMSFEKAMISFDEKDRGTKNLQAELADQHTIMQIIVSESVIRAYQQNKPSLERLKNLEQEYVDLLEETAAYTKYKK